MTFEGVEGSGKSTQCARLAKLLRGEGYQVVETREPGGTPLAEGIREIILSSPAEPMIPQCEALLILAGRSQHVARTIHPALMEGAVVLCDRFSDSTLVYQGSARGLDPNALRALNRFATGGLAPDFTILIDIPVREGMARRLKHDKRRDRLDQEAERFHEKVRKGYLALAAQHSGRMKVIDGTPDLDIVAAKIGATVLPFLNHRRHKGPVGKGSGPLATQSARGRQQAKGKQ